MMMTKVFTIKVVKSKDSECILQVKSTGYAHTLIWKNEGKKGQERSVKV